MEKCTHCRARLKGQIVCSRCKADLEFVLAAEVQAQTMARCAVQSLVSGDIPAAKKYANKARRLHGTLFSRALIGFVETERR